MISEFCICLNISALTTPVFEITQWQESKNHVSIFVDPHLNSLPRKKNPLLTFTARALNKKINQLQKGDVTIIFICLNPVINNRLKKKKKRWFPSLSLQSSKRVQLEIIHPQCLPTCVALFPSFTTSNRLMISIPFS